MIQFSSSWHRNNVVQFYLDNYVRKKQKLWWYSASTGRKTNQEVRICKTLSEDEDARMRGRFLKAAMEAINEASHRPDFFPAWSENAVKEKQDNHSSFGYISLMQQQPAMSSLTKKSSTPSRHTLRKNLRPFPQPRVKTEARAMRKTPPEKDEAKDLMLDDAFDAKIPFWCKYMSVHDWRRNVDVQMALKQKTRPTLAWRMGNVNLRANSQCESRGSQCELHRSQCEIRCDSQCESQCEGSLIAKFKAPPVKRRAGLTARQAAENKSDIATFRVTSATLVVTSATLVVTSALLVVTKKLLVDTTASSVIR